jgi:hypothetical protein
MKQRVLLHNVCEWDANFPSVLANELQCERVIRFLREGGVKSSSIGWGISIDDIQIEATFERGFLHPINLGESIEHYENAYSQCFLKYHKMRQTLHINEDVYTSEHYFRSAYNFLSNLLSAEKITLIIASIDFGYGWELILDQIAMKRQIKRLYLFNNYGDRFFIRTSLEDYGCNSSKADVFAIQSVGKDVESIEHRRVELRSLSARNPRIRYKKSYVGSSYLFIRRVLRSILFSPKDIPSAIIRYISDIRLLKYRRSFSKMPRLEIIRKLVGESKSEGVIYFPLHLQPESSSVMRSGVFEDQCLILEAISSKFPKSFILVKENLNQQEMYSRRSENFFSRINDLKNVQLISPLEPSDELLVYCDLVVTLNGTTGIEAILKGKPVITFGDPFYRDAPGVYSWSEVSDQTDLSADKFKPPNAREVKEWLDRTCQTMGHGNVIDAFWGLPSPFNFYSTNLYTIEQNTKLVCKSLRSAHTKIVSPVPTIIPGIKDRHYRVQLYPEALE